MERGNIIGLYDVTGGGAISLEPGGQFELSGAPLETIHQTQSELMAHLAQVREIAAPLGIGFLGLGMTPTWTRAETPVMPKGRYEIMTRYMPKVGQHGLDMMYRTCTVQVNLDFSSEADMVKKLRVVAGAAADRHGAVRQFAVHRRQAERLPVVPLRDLARHRQRPHRHAAVRLRGRHGLRALCRLGARRADVFRQARRQLHDVAGASFRDFIDGKLPQLPGERPTMSDWANHLSTLFPEVRLKRYLEMRGADGGPWGRLPALPAFWVGLLYDEPRSMRPGRSSRTGPPQERQALRDDVPQLGFKARIKDRYLFEIAKECLGLAHGGLKRRARLDQGGRDESRHLDPLDRIIALGKNPAEEMLDKYNGSWQGSVDPAYKEYCF